MKKRTFLKMSSAGITGSALFPMAGCKQTEPASGRLKNWSGNLEYSTADVVYPESVEQVQAFVKQAGKLRALGSQHCFNRIADSSHQLLSTKNLNRVISLDPVKKTVTVEAGIRYGTLGEHLQNNGYALHNLASLPHISVAGSIATATHGSGVKNGNLATAVSAIEFVTAAGEMATLSKEKDGDRFLGAVVGLGGLGIVTRVTLEIQPSYQVRQDVYENLPFGELERNFEAIMSSGYSVSLFTNWQKDRISEVWVKSRLDEERPVAVKPEFYGATPAAKNLHPIVELAAENCTEQMGVPGPWHERLPHFRMNFTPSSGKELQSEYFVPFANAFAALKAINGLGDKWIQDLFISEIRTIAADDLWMSPCYNRPSVAIHFTWKQNTDSVMKLIPLVEEQLAPFGARPHWGKLFMIPPAQLQARYERFADFQQLLRQYDPQGKFRNEFLDSNLR
ncbi:MAG TPA: D-arabinono-1,4-lactone oxidase [Blastocatellia bacterium]|nr:D-arabinono-1,4-lactone oxidase [Blastocatellia bacterium]